MNKLRIFEGEFNGEMLHEGVVVEFWAIKNGLGLQASFEQSPDKKQFTDLELFQALEALVYGD